MTEGVIGLGTLLKIGDDIGSAEDPRIPIRA
jgi:hypothetical protein